VGWARGNLKALGIKHHADNSEAAKQKRLKALRLREQAEHADTCQAREADLQQAEHLEAQANGEVWIAQEYEEAARAAHFDEQRTPD